MADISDIGRDFRPGSALLPAAIIATLMATTFVLQSGFRSDVAAPRAAPQTVEQIEFVALSREALQGALRDTCAVTRCVSETLHPFVTASAASMTTAELKIALDAQLRVLSESREALAIADVGSDAARLAGLEIVTARRLADLYSAELSAR
ncbi:hypothetical protein [Jannaschia rubra]|uniref:hypothetical protein n=1 Tax=Jannaschia rubra TaxID=282197 RepID=UPI00248FA138|nr:hypothetical protein [Jannaschia rubra]